ncbi:MAG: protein kinase [Gemmataceae bacterium]
MARKSVIARLNTIFVPEVGLCPFPGYRLIQLRGKGGFAEVWETDTPTGERIALKFLSTQKISATARELRALRAIHSIEHPNLLKSKNVWCLPGSVVIGMELADATMLDQFLLYNDELQKPVEPEKLFIQLYQAALGIDFLNSHKHNYEGKVVGLQHGDIKPNNLMICGEVLKIADYGLAVPMITSTSPCHRHGTLDYVAPEVMKGTLTDTSDQFGFAVTYYVLRSGTFPFPPQPSQEVVLEKGLNRPPPDVSLVPPQERAVILKAMSTIPQNRYGGCAEFMRALAKVYDLEFVTGPEAGGVGVALRPLRNSQRIA